MTVMARMRLQLPDNLQGVVVGLVCAWLFITGAGAGDFAQASTFHTGIPKKVLFLSSYHEGYRWTDDIIEGVSSVFGPEGSQIQVDFEYMDAKRRTSPDYLPSLSRFYMHKFRKNDYDLVLCADEPAFRFIKETGEVLFPEKPVVFCGLNHFEPGMLGRDGRMTGVVEFFDLRETLKLMDRLHPEARKVYVVNDDLPTGKSIGLELRKVIPDFPDFEFVSLEGLTMEEVRDRVSRLGPDSLVLFLVFFRDGAGSYFPYDESIRQVSQSSAVPVYGIWDFNLGHGIVGGKLTSGFAQGRMAGELGLKILRGRSPATLPVIREDANSFAFDDLQLKRFGLSRKELPPGSRVINESLSMGKRVLVLHSYDPDMAWVRNIDAGIDSVLSGRPDIQLMHDYLDLKRHPGAAFGQRLVRLFEDKYRGSRFDAILACDSKAYRFMLTWRDRFLPGTPVVFCGVNDFSHYDLLGRGLFTGVVETVDMKGTLDLALKLHRGVRQIVVINDQTDVGRANRKILDAMVSGYAGRADFLFLDDLNMTELRDRVSLLGPDSLILLLSFNRDRSNNVFSYQESIRLIAEKANVPMYGVWDFYLGHGLLGGKMTSGFCQGEAAARMAMRIIDGTPVDDIPVMTESPNRFMFDHKEMVRFGIAAHRLPIGSMVVNQPEDIYSQNPLLVLATLFVVVILAVAVIFLVLDRRQRKKMEAELRYYATTDEMTGVVNRRTGLLMLEQQMALAKREGKPLCICFADLNNLKQINDQWGHDRGDAVIQALCRILKEQVRASDVICRLGGDEFLVILPGCTLPRAGQFWERVRSAICDYNRQAARGEQLSVSRGFAACTPGRPVSLDVLIRRADNAMYRDKERVKARGLTGLSLKGGEDRTTCQGVD